MEHFNKANLKPYDLMPSRKDENQNDKSMTYRAGRSNISNDASNEIRKSAKAPIHLHNNNISTSTFRPQNSAPLDTNNRGNIAKDREVNNSLYESKHSNKIAKAESGPIMEKRDINNMDIEQIEERKRIEQKNKKMEEKIRY